MSSYQPSHSSLFTFPLEDPALEWCLMGDAGRDVDRPALFGAAKVFNGSRVMLDLSSSYFGVNPLSIVVFS
jgi:hypothetical protein